MGNFLDSSGLSRVWSKIGQSFLSKGGGTITGGVITMDSSGLPALDSTRVPTYNLAVGRNGIAFGGIDAASDGAAIYLVNRGSDLNTLVIAIGDNYASSSVDDIEFRYYNYDGNFYTISVPHSTGTLALTSQIPTNNNQLSNGAGYITSSGSCNYASSSGNADTVDNCHETSFFRYRDSISADYVDLTEYGSYATGYQNPSNGIYGVQRSGYSASMLAFTGAGSASGLDIYFSYSRGSEFKFRRRIDSNRLSGAWENILTDVNWTSYISSVSNADTVDGYHASAFALSHDHPYLALAGGTMTGTPYINMPASPASISDSQPFGITYGKVQCYGTMYLAADTDGSQSEYVILTAGYGMSSATVANGLAVGYSTLTWKNNTVLHTGNWSSYISQSFHPLGGSWKPSSLSSYTRHWGWAYSSAEAGLASDGTDMQIYTDGRFWQREGAYYCLDNGNTYVTGGTGVINGSTITEVSNADTVDGYHASNLFVQNRGAAPTNFVDMTNYWDYSDPNYVNLDSGTYYVSRSGYSELLVVFRGTGSTSSLQLYTSYSDTATLYYRKTVDSSGLPGGWRYFITSCNIGSQSVNYAGSAGNADTVDGYHYNNLPYLSTSGGTVSGNIYATGTISCGSASDSRLKDNIEELDLHEATNIISSLRPVSFRWSDKATELSDQLVGDDIGLVAQDVESLVPSAISTIFNDYLRLDYTKLIAPIIKVEQDLMDRVERLEEENKKLKEIIRKYE